MRLLVLSVSSPIPCPAFVSLPPSRPVKCLICLKDILGGLMMWFDSLIIYPASNLFQEGPSAPLQMYQLFVRQWMEILKSSNSKSRATSESSGFRLRGFEVWNRTLSLVHLMLNKGHRLCCLMCLHYLIDAPGKSPHTPGISCPFPLPMLHFQSWSGKGFSFHSHAPCIDRLFQVKETKQREQEFRQAAWNNKRCMLPNAQSITISITESNIFLHFWIITGFIHALPSPQFLNLFVGLYHFSF